MIMSGEQWWMTAAFWWPLLSAASGACPYYHSHPTPPPSLPHSLLTPTLTTAPTPPHPPLPPPAPQPQAWPVTHGLYINLWPTASPACHSSNFPLAWCSFLSRECRAKKAGSLQCLRQKQGLRWGRVAEVVVEKTGALLGRTAKPVVMKLQWEGTWRKTEDLLDQCFFFFFL